MTIGLTRHRLSRRRPVQDTLMLMRRLVRQFRDEPRIRDAALRATVRCGPVDDEGRMREILNWTRKVVRYERDVADQETISDPLHTLERVMVYGAAAGDCDDAAVLMAALLESIGIRTRFVAVSARRDRQLHHVAIEAYDKRRDAWRHLDPFRPDPPPGRAHLAYTREMRLSV